MSDYRDLTIDLGTTPNDDIEFNSIGAELELGEFRSIQVLLMEDYQISMDLQEIADTMDDAGIDFQSWSWSSGLMIHEALFEHLSEDTE
tara:strand:- start:1340 stop:1606 length:267 start_codon:yes stop_codon:yes gene_type:complete